MEQVEVFSTSVSTPGQVAWLTNQLQGLFPTCRITFDLEDCDKVLRLAGDRIELPAVVACLRRAGFACTPLE